MITNQRDWKLQIQSSNSEELILFVVGFTLQG